MTRMSHGPLIILLLFGAGIVGGMLAGLVGGASLVTFPALLAIGLPPVTATASNLVAVSAGNFARRVHRPRPVCRRSTAASSAWSSPRCSAR